MTGVRAVRMRLGLPDASGRQSVEPVEGSQFTVPADLVIKALGFDPEDLPAAFGAAGAGGDALGHAEGRPPHAS